MPARSRNLVTSILAFALVCLLGTAAQAGEKVFRDCDVCPQMVVVPVGEFLMGSAANEPERWDNEGPQHRVAITKPFAIGKFEISVDEFNAFAEATDHDVQGACWTDEEEDWQNRPGRSFRKPGFPQNGRHPATCVSLVEIRNYLRWLNAMVSDGTYALPSEAQWEYAARAGTSTAFSTGNAISPSQANFDGTYALDGRRVNGINRKATVPVGSFPANAFGLHDFHGNASEWVEDCYHWDYKLAPADGTPRHSSFCNRFVVRGGSWLDRPTKLRSANRERFFRSYRSAGVGFRVAKSLDR